MSFAVSTVAVFKYRDSPTVDAPFSVVRHALTVGFVLVVEASPIWVRNNATRHIAGISRTLEM